MLFDSHVTRSLPFEKSETMHTDQYVPIGINFQQVSIQLIKP